MIQGGNAKAREALGETVLYLKDLKSKYTSHSSLSYKEKLTRIATAEPNEPAVVNDTKQASLIDFNDDPIKKQTNLIDTDEDEFDIFKSVPKQQSNNDTLIFDEIKSSTPFIFEDLVNTSSETQKSSIFDDLVDTNSNTKQATPSIFDELTDTNPIQSNPSIFDELADHTVTTTPTNAAVDNFFDQFENPTPVVVTSKPTTTKRTLKATKPNHRSKLGARKVESNVFQQQAKIAFQEEKMREEGVDEESIDRSSRNQLMMSHSQFIPKLQPPTSSRLDYQAPTTNKEEEPAVEKERLGMMALSFNNNKKSHLEMVQQDVENEERFAREKFGNAKSISSDQYFGREAPVIRTSSSSNHHTRNTSISKKLLKAASNKIQNMLAEMDN